jgi:hypothetical protein
MTGQLSQLAGYTRLREPELVFHNRARARHPLVGLIEHGPYGLRFGAPSRLRLALVARADDQARLRGLVGELRRRAKPREALNYYPEYPGFEPLFRTPIAELSDRTSVRLPASLDGHAAAGDKARARISTCTTFSRPTARPRTSQSKSSDIRASTARAARTSCGG